MATAQPKSRPRTRAEVKAFLELLDQAVAKAHAQKWGDSAIRKLREARRAIRWTLGSRSEPPALTALLKLQLLDPAKLEPRWVERVAASTVGERRVKPVEPGPGDAPKT